MSEWIRFNGRLQTPNLTPGRRAYGERLNQVQGREYREWSARRSKLAAYIERGGRGFRAADDQEVLYLGAASGTTVSHVSDLAPKGRVFAVEFSPRPFRELLQLAAARPNIVPILCDAATPEAYQAYLARRVPMVYQDIAQRNQAQLFLENARRFLARDGVGFLAIKARSINVAWDPRRTYDAVKAAIVARDFEFVELVTLDPFEKDHAMLVVRRRG